MEARFASNPSHTAFEVSIVKMIAILMHSILRLSVVIITAVLFHDDRPDSYHYLLPHVKLVHIDHGQFQI
ncbi:hypothetical protein M378DRAFT_163726 [Amanita muscaria Koide BX008]|uniref:Uncharacterized protein n=1 Tax=Amanita muscaria (strain Koide BX008) TaxID=946122 RepID=A0A0C2SLJ7_AMAMK|nr:hypothetical protein M378DRAFT_163726 [Amanita muscaria Koide BX008]